MAGQIDQDVDLVGDDPLRGAAMIHRAHIDEGVRGLADAIAHLILVQSRRQIGHACTLTHCIHRIIHALIHTGGLIFCFRIHQ